MKIERDGPSGIAVILDDHRRVVVPGAAVQTYADAPPGWSGDRAYWSEVELRGAGDALLVRTGDVTDHEGGTDYWRREKVFRSTDGGRTWTELPAPPRFGEEKPLARLSTHWDALERVSQWRIVRRVRRTMLGDLFEAFTAGTEKVHLLVLERVGGDARARVAAVAQKLLALRHPNVATTLAFDDTPERPPLLVVEELRGRTLDGAEKMPPASVARIGVELCAGLDALHAAGVVHGFVRPESVVLADVERNLPSVAKLVDSGLLLAAEDPRGTRGSLRMPNDLGYVPLEQTWPPSKYAASADVFGIGAILYELACGRRAFRGSSLPEIMGAMTKGAEPLELDALGAVIMRAIAKDPRERFATAADMLHALKGARAAFR